MTSVWTVALLVAAVAIVAMFLRRRTGVEEVRMPPATPGPSDGAPADDVLDADRDDVGEDEGTAAISVDGIAFIGMSHGVHLAPLPEAAEAAGGPPPGRLTSAEFLRPGDFTAARIVRGSSEDPWRLELMGPEGEYLHYGFATEEAATAALALLEQHEVMQYVRDDDDRPLRPSAEQFDEARRRAEETERLLAMTLDEDAEPR